MTVHVAIATAQPRYPAAPPYAPDRLFPEVAPAGIEAGNEPNPAYTAVRDALRLLDLDAANVETPAWNPFGKTVRPGDTVVLKPNFVREFRERHPGHGECLITHGAVIRAALDYVYLALNGTGRIIIADAPQNDADFTAIRRITGLDEIQRHYRDRLGFEVEVYDLRPERARKIDGVIIGHEPLAGDPAGYVRVDLGRDSAFCEIGDLCRLLYGAEYDTDELHRHQHGDVHEYLISRTILEADIVIGLPKLKTHKKVGLTVNLKNLVGINGNKNWLPHHREGTPAQGGDQFADDRFKRRLERGTVAQFKRLFPLLGPLRPIVARPTKALGKRLFGDTDNGTVRSGNWYGNDTAWRMVLDLNRILRYADRDGRLADRPARRFFSIVDGIIAGEGNGPLDADPKPAGLVLAGADPLAVDLAAGRIMGFDYARIPLLCRAFDASRLPLTSFSYDEVEAHSDDYRFNGRLVDFDGPMLAFRPHFGWKDHVELRADGARAATT
jgi:uncharacterized protein (DUF362 family)